MKKQKQAPLISCASCGLAADKKICMQEDGSSSRGCPTLTKKDILEEANKEYDVAEIREFARNASIQEADCYANRHQRPYIMQPSKTRITEVCEFATKMGYKRLGLAFCMGLAREAGVVEDILKSYGFEVVSALCKAGRVSKDRLGLKDEDKIFQGTDESMCNPIYQAKLLSQRESEVNIQRGVCVGHDALFFKYAEAPTTVLAVKDRVTGHNPLAAIYLSETYQHRTYRPFT